MSFILFPWTLWPWVVFSTWPAGRRAAEFCPPACRFLRPVGFGYPVWMSCRVGLCLLVALILFVFDVDLGATPSPWETVGKQLCDLFFLKLGKALAIVAVIIGGLMYAFGEGGSKSQIAGLAFGAGMVLLAPEFLGWILGSSKPKCG